MGHVIVVEVLFYNQSSLQLILIEFCFCLSLATLKKNIFKFDFTITKQITKIYFILKIFYVYIYIYLLYLLHSGIIKKCQAKHNWCAIRLFKFILSLCVHIVRTDLESEHIEQKILKRNQWC